MDENIFDSLFEAMSRFTYLSNNKIALPNTFSDIDVMFEKVNLTQQQLIIKIRNGGPVQIAKIAQTFALKRPNATRLANSLVKLGWCQKIKKDNTRHVYLALSPKGTELLELDRKITREGFKALFDKYATLKEQKKMLELYTFVNSVLERFP